MREYDDTVAIFLWKWYSIKNRPGEPGLEQQKLIPEMKIFGTHQL